MRPRFRAGLLRAVYQPRGHPGSDDHVDRVLEERLPASTDAAIRETAAGVLDAEGGGVLGAYHADGLGIDDIAVRQDMSPSLVVLSLQQAADRLRSHLSVCALVTATDPSERATLLRQLAYACPAPLAQAMREAAFPWPPTEQFVSLLDAPARWVRELAVRMIGRSRGGGTSNNR